MWFVERCGVIAKVINIALLSYSDFGLVSLVSAIVLIVWQFFVFKNQVEDVEGKLDTLIDMCRADREHRTQAHMLPPSTDPQGHHGEGHDEVKDQGPHGTSTENLQLLAVAKRLRSEPCTPILKNPDKPMLRNLSDLGPRVKKKVTYSSNHSIASGSHQLVAKSCVSPGDDPSSVQQQSSTEGSLPTVFITQYQPHHHESVGLLSHQPSIVREEEEEGVGPRLTIQLEPGLLPVEMTRSSSWMKDERMAAEEDELNSSQTTEDCSEGEIDACDYVQCIQGATTPTTNTLTDH